MDIALDSVSTMSTLGGHDQVRHGTTGAMAMRRRLRRLSIERLMRVRWTVRRTVTLSGGASLVAAVVIVVLLATGTVGPGVPACKTATPTLPDYQVAPFAFHPEVRAYAFAQAMADDDFETAYAMLAHFPESGASLCDFALEEYWEVFRSARSPVYWDAVVERPALKQAFDPFEDVVLVQYQVNFEDGSSTEPGGLITLMVWRDGRVSPFYDWDAADRRPSGEYPAPAYANAWAFEEFDVTIEGPGGDLAATVAIPRGPAHYPAVVLVPGMWTALHADRDATTPRVKPLRDLAWGLASQGIATLRYDKRTWAHPAAAARQPDFTLMDEYVEDALAAVDLLRRAPKVDPSRVHVLAFEHAGFAGPRIAQLDPDLAGLILYSAPSGTMWDAFLSIIERQIRNSYEEELRSSDADVRARARAEANRELHAYRTHVAQARALAAGETVANLTLRPAYHRDLAGYQPAEAARSLQLPILVVHGALHSMGSGLFNHWLESLHQHPNASFFLYPDHYDYLFDLSEWREADTPSQRAEALPRHVAPEAVADIADWIRGGRPKEACIGTQTGPQGCRGGPDARVSGWATE